MKKLILPISVGILCVSFTYKSLDAGSALNRAAAVFRTSPDHSVSVLGLDADMLYERLGLENEGLSPDAFHYAVKGYRHLAEKSMLSKPGIITVCDFSQSSAKKRLFIIDVESEQLLVKTYVAHGKNSGAEFATKFSNTPESLQSSLGFFVTRETYTGKHGLSLRLQGVDGIYNNQAYARTIVIHGASYVDESRAKNGGYMGRSWGCPAVPKNESGKIIQLIKQGTCFFIYHPQKQYLRGSKILNG